jgi:hypothetical protein
MQLMERTYPDNFDLFLLGDSHDGSLSRHKDGWYQALEHIRSKRTNRVWLGGDLIEGICVDDHRYNIETSDGALNTPTKQCNSVVKDLNSIKNQIDFILEGNHEWKLQKFGNLTRDHICAKLFGEELKYKYYGTYTTKMTLKDKSGNIMFKGFYTHGNGTINSSADDPLTREAHKQKILKRRLQFKAADCLLMATAHTHQLVVAKPAHELYLTDENGRLLSQYTEQSSKFEPHAYIDPNLRWYVSSGSFLKLYLLGATGYAERLALNPTQLGYAVAEIRDRKLVNIRKVELN